MAAKRFSVNTDTRTTETAWIKIKGRFAPSPTGRMHLGNVYCALLSWLSARSRGGEWLLRIEDIDTQRSRREYAEQIADDLHWLGLEWDGFCRQSERSALYEEALAALRPYTYYCQCTRADILASQAPHESDGRVVYAGTCREAGHTNGALRIRVPDADIFFTDAHYGPQRVNLAEHCGDFILRRRDGAWAYQLAVVVDDALTGVTEVVRGRDLLLSATQQIHLFRLLGQEPPVFCHAPLLLNTAGQRLSKRDASLDMSHLRQRYTPQQLLGLIAHIAGLTASTEPLSLPELLQEFSWAKVPSHDITVSQY